MTTAPNNPKPRRRFWQYSLRTFFLLLTVFGVWLGWMVHRVNERREVARWIREMGGTFQYDFQLNERGDRIEDAQPPGPDWLRERIGIEWFADVVKVEFYGAPTTDMGPLSKLPELRHVSFGKTPITDLSPFANLTKLELLYLNDTRVSDLTPLASATSLEMLFLDDTQVSDITPLSHLTNLKLLNLYGTQVSDVTPIHGLTSLESLNINAARVSKEDYKSLKQALPGCNIYWFPRLNRSR